MRAAVVRSFGGPEAIELLTIAKPIIREDQVLVRNLYAGVNPVDTYIRSGQYAKLPLLPYSPGKDGAGIVEQVGANVKNIKVGDRVWYTEQNSSAHYTAVSRPYQLPDTVSFSEGASLGVPYLTAYRAMFILAGTKTGDVILVHGASGGVGCALTQLASWKKIKVVGTAGSVDGIELVKKLGAFEVFDHSSNDYIDEIKKKYPTGFNHIFEMAAHNNLNADLGLLAPGGKVAVIGNRSETVINARQLMTTEGAIFGVALGLSTPEQLRQSGNEIYKFLKETPFRPIINKEYSLEEIGSAHRDILNKKANGNIVIRID